MGLFRNLWTRYRKGTRNSAAPGTWVSGHYHPQACRGKLREQSLEHGSLEPGTEGCEKAPVTFTRGTQPACCNPAESDLGE